MTVNLNTYNHYWKYCGHCERDVVICGVCGNNSCNGGYGEVDGELCVACPSAYEIQSDKDKAIQPNKEEIYIIDTGFK